MITKADAARPADAAGAPVLRMQAYTLWRARARARARPGIPGRDRCSQAMVETVTNVDTGGG